MKQSRPGYHIKPIVLKVFSDDPNVCLIRVLNEYLSRTESLRSTCSDDQLFIGFQRPHESVSVETISPWLKMILKSSEIDV